MHTTDKVFLSLSLFALLSAQMPAAAADSRPIRIVNGDKARPGAQPWMAALVERDGDSAFAGHFCGGSLIAPRWVLTAAHCVAGAGEFDVVLGRANLEHSGGERIAVSRIVSHPQYDAEIMEKDIALLKLASASTYPPLQIDTPAIAAARPGVTGRVLGWGATRGTEQAEDDLDWFDTWLDIPENLDCELTTTDGSQAPSGYFCLVMPEGDENAEIDDELPIDDSSDGSADLLEVSLPLVDNETCREAYRTSTAASFSEDGNVISDDMLCAGYSDASKDSCLGDSGGPLVVMVDGQAVQVGVVSWGEGCAQSGYYGVYSRVASLNTFIQANLASDYFEQVCPSAMYPPPALQVEQADAGNGRQRVTLSWNAVPGVEGYSLFFTTYPQAGVPDHVDLPAVTEFSVVLERGMRFLIALQAYDAVCSGPLSALRTVVVE